MQKHVEAELIPWWVILVAVICAFILLAILIYVMHKVILPS